VRELGLFPLGIVLLPKERIPLHVFEPRYKELIGECVEHGREFGLVLADDDGLHDVGTLASVSEVLDRFEDGRMNVVVEGGARFRVARLTSGRSFQTAEVEPVEDDEKAVDPEARERALALFHQLSSIAEADVGEPDEAAPGLSFDIAGRVDFGATVKIEALIELLEKAVDTLEREKVRAERASGNGRVSDD